MRNVAELNTGSDEWVAFLSADALHLYYGSAAQGSGDLYVATREARDEPFENPQGLDGINTAFTEVGLSMTADGLEAYFVSDRPGGKGDRDIWVATRPSVDEPFTDVRNLEAVNTGYVDGFPSISADGLTLFWSDFPWASPRPDGMGGADIWCASRAARDEPFGEAVNLKSPINTTGTEFWVRLSPRWPEDGSLVHFNRCLDLSCNDMDIYQATWRLSSPAEWSAPVNLGPAINSTANDQQPGISKDGLSLYFASDRADGLGLGGLDIYVSQRSSLDDPWGPPANLGPKINSAGNDLAQTLSPDGSLLYFCSNGRGGCGGSDLFVSQRRDQRDDLGWQEAENLGCVVNSPFEDCGPTIFEDEEAGITTLIFTTTRPGGPGDFDIYQSIRIDDEGEFGPATLVAELSAPFRDTRTAISRDGLELFLSSDVTGRPSGVGSQDLWVATRATTTDPWSAPVNLGPTVNSSAFDGAPALSFDGTTLYFFSEREDGFGKKDLWVTTRVAEVKFRRGDCNADGAVDIADAVCILNWLFTGGAAPGCVAATNTNGDDAANVADATYLLNHLFAEGPALVAPFPDCGPATLPADEELSCVNPPDCQ